MTQDTTITPPGTGDNTPDDPGHTGPRNTPDGGPQTGPDGGPATGSGGGPDGSGPGRGTVVPFRRPDPGTDPATIEGEVLEPGTDLTAGPVRQTWGTRVLHGTGKVLAGPSDETRARLADATVEFSHTAGRRVAGGARRGGRGLRRAGRFAHRHVRIIGNGMDAARLRRRADTGHRDLKTARRAAAEKGDAAAVEALTKQHNEARHVTVDTLTKWGALIWGATWRAAAALGVLFVVSVIVGFVNGFGYWLGNFGALTVLGTWRDILAAVWAVGVFVVTWWWAGAALAAAVKVSRWWRDGNRLGEQVLPAHLRKLSTANLREELTESAMVTALANIRHAKLANAIKQGWPNRDGENPWVQFPMIDGKGWAAKIRLPHGVPVQEIEKQKHVLAHNLACRPVELFIRTDDDDPTVMDLFRLNRGVMREPVDPFPLLHEGTCDYWTSGFPVGVNLRGEPITMFMPERNFALAGAPGSGKSTLMRAIVAGAVLDPLVDVDVFVFADNNDYEPLKPVLTTYSAGAKEEHVDAALEHLQALYDDLTARGRLLQKHNVGSVLEAGRAIVAKEPGLRPRVVVLEECQRLFRQDKPEDRKKVVNLVINLFMAARKYAIHLAFVTPSPSDQSLPRDLIAVTTNKACGAIGDKTRNNVVLGEKAHENGISALDLKPKNEKALNDCGTLITVGFMDEPGALRSYFLSAGDMAQVATRAAELRGASQVTDVVVARDPLADMLTVLAGMTPREDEDHPRAAAVAAALAARWNHYSGWQIQHVTDVLARHHYKIPSTQRIYPVDAAKVAEALHARDADGAE